MNSNPEKILIIRMSSIGDILLSTPFIRQTRNKFPHAQIDFVIKEKYYSLLSANPYLNTVYQLRSGRIIPLIKSLRRIKYDYIFDLHGNIRSRLITMVVNSGFVSRIRKGKFTQQLLVRFKINRYKRIIPVPERYLKAGQSAGIEDDRLGLEFFWDKQSEDKTISSLQINTRSKPGRFVAIAPGAGFFTKRWPVDYFIDLTERIRKHYGAHFFILGDDRDKQLGKVIGQGRDWFTDLTGRLGLMEAGALLSRCAVAVTNDSGMMHMASAVEIPVLAIFGSSVKEFGFFPYRCRNIVVEHQSLKCRPCSHIGRASCPLSHFKCMRELTPAVAMNAFEQLIPNWDKK